GVQDGENEAAAMAESLGELWRFGFEASSVMADRVLELYQGMPSGLGFSASDAEIEAELRRVRVDLERAVDFSVDIVERVLSLARRLGVRDDQGRPPSDLVFSVEPGGMGSAEVWVHNTSSEMRPAPAFRCTELVTFDGAQIAAEQVRVLCGDEPIEAGNS